MANENITRDEEGSVSIYGLKIESEFVSNLSDEQIEKVLVHHINQWAETWFRNSEESGKDLEYFKKRYTKLIIDDRLPATCSSLDLDFITEIVGD